MAEQVDAAPVVGALQGESVGIDKRPGVLEAEATSVREVRRLAEHHAGYLPADSWWKGFWRRLANALAADEARLGLAGIHSQGSTAGNEFVPEQRDRLEAMREAARRVAEVFDPLSPWGSASRAIEVRLGRALATDQGQRLQPLTDEAAGNETQLLEAAQAAVHKAAACRRLPNHAQVALRAAADLLGSYVPPENGSGEESPVIDAEDLQAHREVAAIRRREQGGFTTSPAKPESEQTVVELGRWERNNLSRIVAQSMQNAGEALATTSRSEEAIIAAAAIARLTPLRNVLGWKRKAGKKKADKTWLVPVDLLLRILPPIQAELREEFEDLLKATQAQEGRGEPGFSRESMGHVSESLDAVNHVLAAAREQAEGGRS